MSSVTQKISSYVHGLNEQPDHLKKAGQVNEANNVLPDVTLGLTKRPGSKYINRLSTQKGGKWFSIFRDDNEKYICQYIDGGIKIWSAIDGTPRVVRYNSNSDLTNPEDGGVGLPANPGDTPSEPPDNSVPPTLPAGCDPVLMNTKLTVWLAKRSEITQAETTLKQALDDYNYRVANRKVKYTEYRWYSAMTGTWTPWQRSETRPPNVYFAAPRETRTITEGIYTQAEIDGYYSGTVTPAQNAVNDKQAEEVPLKKEYEAEAIKCGITSNPVTRTTRAATVRTTNITIPYLANAKPEDISILTVNDYTFITNRTAVTSMGETKTSERPYEAFLQIKALEYGSEYRLDIHKPAATASRRVSYATALSVEPANWEHGDGACIYTKTETFDKTEGGRINLRYSIETRGQAQPVNSSDPYSGYKCVYKTYVTLLNGGENWVTGDGWQVTMEGRVYNVYVKSHAYRYVYDTVINVPTFLTPVNSNTETIKYDVILSHFKTEIEKNFGWFADIIGPGLYIKGPVPFSVNATGGRNEAAVNALTNKVNNISRLPNQCKDGYVVKVLNSGEIEDDYWVKFIGTEPGVDGAGAWEETVAPGIPINFNPNSMPHQLVRMPDGTFMFSPVDWENRLVGDDKTNPKPSFVNRTINKMAFYRNRLVMLSDENIILSAAGDFFNFWAKTAVTISDSDPIDFAATSTTPCVLSDCIAMQTGLLLFSRDKQYIFSTSQDTLSPSQSKVEILSTYPYNTKTPVLDMGTTVGFLTNAGTTSRFFEMTGIQPNATPEALEQSKIVSNLLPEDIDSIADSKENSVIAFGVSGKSKAYLYRYFNDGQKRILSSWFTWDFAGNLIYHTIDKDTYYSVITVDGGVTLCSSNLVINKNDYIVYGTEVSYEPRLDVRVDVPLSDITYDFRTETSKFSIPYSGDKDRLILFGTGKGRYQGRVTQPISITANPTTDQWDVVVKGNWSKMNVSCGYLYNMSVKFPTTYVTKTDGERSITDSRAYLTINRCKLGFGNVGMFNTTIKRKGEQDYTNVWEMSPGNEYEANTHEVLPIAQQAIPIYQKNTNYTLTLTSSHPTPATLLSMEWEGNYSNMYYNRV